MIFMAEWQRMRAIIPLPFIIFTETVGLSYLPILGNPGYESSLQMASAGRMQTPHFII